jgi:hypothetical protein
MSTRVLPQSVELADLRLGDLLAEGGEGRVFELPLQPHLVFKSYREVTPRPWLEELVAWPEEVGSGELAARVRAAAAWPAAVVTASPGPTAGAGGAPAMAGAVGAPVAGVVGAPAVAGAILPRAPRRFALRHRDGSTRLATLSYLTADPAYRALAYGLSLPEPMSPLRVGIVYALARLLAAFEAAQPPISHGDLSTKNVLWSLQRGPEVFVLDCDNCERIDARPSGDPGLPGQRRRRAMTPNWEDPAVPPGGNPTLETDRYSLALIFLRLTAAANFPIQARQRQVLQGTDNLDLPVTLELSVPDELWGEPLLLPESPLLRLCSRGLSVESPSIRPPAAAWLAPLEALLDAMGASDVVRSVWAAQGGGSPSAPVVFEDLEASPGVTVAPVRATPRSVPRWTRSVAQFGGPRLVGSAAGTWSAFPRAAGGFPGSGAGGLAQRAAGGLSQRAAGGLSQRGAGGLPRSGAGGFQPGRAEVLSASSIARQPVWPEVRQHLAVAVRWWVRLHLRAFGAKAGGRRRPAGGSLALCVGVDVLLALWLLFAAAMIVSPFVGL